MKQKSKFKKTEIGKIPEDWEIGNLGNYTNLIKGISYRSKDYCSEDEGFIFINLKCVARNGGFRYDGIKYYKGVIREEQFVNPGDILIANTDITQNKEVIGSPVKVPQLEDNKKICISLDLSKLEVTSKRLNGDFLYYYLMSPKARHFMIANSNGTTVVHLSTKNVPNLIIPIPNLKEQEKIIKILSDLDSKIELNQQMNKTLEKIGQTIFKQWFIDFEFPNGKGKPYKSSGGEMVDSEMGEIPRGWKIGKYEDLVNISTGKGLRREEFSEKGKYAVLGANGELGRTNNFLFDERLILTGRVGTLGTVYLLRGKYWISDNVLISKPKSEENYYYSYFIIKLFDFKSLNRGSTQPLITQTDLKNQIVLIPDNTTLLQFHKICLSMFDKIYQNELENVDLSQIRDSLLPRLMSGKIRVPVEVPN